MSLSSFKRPIAPVGDLEGPYLREFWAAWEDDTPAPPPPWRTHLVLVSCTDSADAPESVTE